MRTIETKIYKFSELDNTAKQRAKDKYAEHNGYSWAADSLASLKALAEHFSGKLKDYEVDFFACSHSSADFSMPEMEKDEIASRLSELGAFDPVTLRGRGACKLTGYCADEDAIDGFRKAFHDGETDLEKLMDSAFDSWLKAAQSDCEAQYEDDNFSEHCDANEYEFHEDGSMA